MDPMATIEAMLAANDTEEYRGYLADLLAWYDQGGFMPDGAVVSFTKSDGEFYRHIGYNGVRFTWWGIRGD
jgi:hypothetical protein